MGQKASLTTLELLLEPLAFPSEIFLAGLSGKEPGLPGRMERVIDFTLARQDQRQLEMSECQSGVEAKHRGKFSGSLDRTALFRQDITQAIMSLPGLWPQVQRDSEMGDGIAEFLIPGEDVGQVVVGVARPWVGAQ